jgi:hypothetical protein
MVAEKGEMMRKTGSLPKRSARRPINGERTAGHVGDPEPVFGIPNVPHEIGADIGNDGESTEHEKEGERERTLVIGFREGGDESLERIGGMGFRQMTVESG